MDSYDDNLHKKSPPVLYEYAKQMREESNQSGGNIMAPLKKQAACRLEVSEAAPGRQIYRRLLLS